MMQANFIVEIIMTNKEMARDPVGATIKRDLLAKKGYDILIFKLRVKPYIAASVLIDIAVVSVALRKECGLDQIPIVVALHIAVLAGKDLDMGLALFVFYKEWISTTHYIIKKILKTKQW